jgi:membrane-bound lytic murein transglycosylase D
MKTKPLLGILMSLGFVFLSFTNAVNPETAISRKKDKEESSPKKVPTYSKEEILSRLEDQKSPVDVRWNADVKRSIKDYTVKGRRSAEIILGRSAIYFPMFNENLEKHGLPQDLKYMSVIESLLDPKAVSPVGAAGLWQFMPATARRFGLKIDNYVDERYDPLKSTEAAMRYLKVLHNRFEDWTLAIAAYNCGEGCVEKAIKKGDSRDFWKLRKHLPKETGRYVSRFIAASYVMNNYIFHDLKPAYPDYDLQLTKSVKVYKRKSFDEISKETGYSLEIIKRLNPSYKLEIIPPTAEGSYLILPKIS